MASDEWNDPWCKAMHDCTACLREQRPQDADHCLAYLWVLEQQLGNEGVRVDENNASDSNDEDYYEDDKIPVNYPLRWNQFCATVQASQNLEVAMNKGSMERPRRMRKNYSMRLSGQRLLTRLLTFRSEVFVMKATHIARNLGDWNRAAQSYAKAIQTIHQALGVTDTSISKWWNRWENQLELIQSDQEHLVKDASIVEVALESLVDKRNRLLAQAHREENRLVRKLTPQWESRDAIKEKLGDRWTNNPAPKYDHAKLRADMEADLKQVRAAMTSLEELDPNQALQKATGLKQGLLTHQRQPTTAASTATAPNESMEELLQANRRYNNQRPSMEWIARRVSLQDYPDPVDFGWTFTGSWKSVEFFERYVTPVETTNGNDNSNSDQQAKLVKLDWYFTTGTIKTSLDHPIQGKTQLFAKQCTPQLYAKVLANPRIHTGKRYQRKPPPKNANRKQRKRPQ